MSIRIGKVFDPEWPDPVRSNPEATKSMLQAEYETRAKRVERLRINLSSAYDLEIGKCTDYLWSRLEGQGKWETTSIKREILKQIKSVKSLSQKYDRDME